MAETSTMETSKPQININENDRPAEEEEFWPVPPLLTVHKTHTIRLGGCLSNPGDNHQRVLRYKSMSGQDMTPLDMDFGEVGEADEFYDGTGNLLWMAAVCFSHMVAQRVDRLLPFLPMSTRTDDDGFRRKQKQICELGCGTGGAGISLLLCCSNQTTATSCDSSGGTATTMTRNFEGDGCHIVFTDNDSESLELCRLNCELNDINSTDYSHELLWWGNQEEAKENELSSSSAPSRLLEQHSFDTVLATDVVYDLKMIAPLMQTVEFLLKPPQNDRSIQQGGACSEEKDEDDDEKGGHLILSHVPRFCIPRNSDDSDDNLRTSNDDPRNCNGSDGNSESNQAYLDLEAFIQSEANKVGLSLVETIRPHEVLSDKDLTHPHSDDEEDCSSDDDSMQKLTLESMKEAHAVLFVFQKR